jgi:hypothetical protein
MRIKVNQNLTLFMYWVLSLLQIPLNQPVNLELQNILMKKERRNLIFKCWRMTIWRRYSIRRVIKWHFKFIIHNKLNSNILRIQLDKGASLISQHMKTMKGQLLNSGSNQCTLNAKTTHLNQPHLTIHMKKKKSHYHW